MEASDPKRGDGASAGKPALESGGISAESRLLRLAVDASPAGLLVADEVGRILLANERLHRKLGYDAGELIGRRVEELLPTRTRAMGGGRDVVAVRKNGDELPVEVGTSARRIDGELFLVYSVVNITARRQERAQLEETIAALQRSNRTLEELAQAVSHDVRAPLRGIAVTAQFLAEDLERVADPESRENLRLLRRRTEHLTTLVEGVLRYSRAGLRAAELREIDAGAIAREVVEMIEIPTGVRVRLEDPLPRVVYDAAQLHQVLQNLIGNAVEHLGRDTGEVRVGAAPDGAQWRFFVADDGVGIPADQHERIFKLFQTLAPAENADRPKGIGLGLAIVRRIVENAGGTVGVRSEPGRGTEFSFTIPRAAHDRRLPTRRTPEGDR